MATVAVLERLSKSPDIKKALLKELGDLSGIGLIGRKVLVAIHVGGERFVGSTLIRPTSQLKEDIWQGNCGLVVKIGDAAFKDDSGKPYKGERVGLHDWVCFIPGEGKRVQINGIDCRVFDDDMFQFTLADPQIITHWQ